MEFAVRSGIRTRGLEWGSSVAARYRVVRDERTRGSALTHGTRRAAIVAGARWALVNVSYCRSSGYALPMRRAGRRRGCCGWAGLSATF